MLRQRKAYTKHSINQLAMSWVSEALELSPNAEDWEILTKAAEAMSLRMLEGLYDPAKVLKRGASSPSDQKCFQEQLLDNEQKGDVTGIRPIDAQSGQLLSIKNPRRGGGGAITSTEQYAVTPSGVVLSEDAPQRNVLRTEGEVYDFAREVKMEGRLGFYLITRNSIQLLLVVLCCQKMHLREMCCVPKEKCMILQGKCKWKGD